MSFLAVPQNILGGSFLKALLAINNAKQSMQSWDSTPLRGTFGKAGT